MRGDTVGKDPTVAVPVRMVSSRSTGGFALRGTGASGAGSVPCGEGGVAGEFPSPPPPRLGNVSREVESKVDVVGSLVCVVGEGRKGIADEVSRRKAEVIANGDARAAREDAVGLRVHTGASGLNTSDWSLESCDDADDGAVRFDSTLCIGSVAALPFEWKILNVALDGRLVVDR